MKNIGLAVPRSFALLAFVLVCLVIGSSALVVAQTTTTAVAALPSTITLGDTVTFTATVNATPPGTATITGLVIFFDGNTPLGSAALNGTTSTATASFSTAVLSVSGSPHSITATYLGDATHDSSSSSAISETVNPRTSTTGVVLNPTTVVAGQSSTATVTVTDSGTVPPGTADTFSSTGAPGTGRTGFTATLIADGAVLITGGTDANNNVLNTAEVYSGGTFSPTPGNLNTARTGAGAVLLPNAKVLIVGGSSDGTANGALDSAELLDPNTGTFVPTSNNMTAARFGGTITLLNTGKVLIAGGENSGGVLSSAELYDPIADTFTATGNMTAARTGPSATLLGTGKVLIAGGSDDGTINGAWHTAELFDPAGNSGAGTFAPVAGANPNLEEGRWQPQATLLLSGKVLVAGGRNFGGFFAAGLLTTADVYDPVTDSFTHTAHIMNEARGGGSAVTLPNGMVLLAGGSISQVVDLYDPENDRFNTTGSLLQSDSGLVSTLLNNGDVLVIGLTTAATPASDAELYSPSFNPLGTVVFVDSEPTDSITGACILTPSNSTDSTCTSTVTPANVASSPHTITGTYVADAVHLGSSSTTSLTVNKADTTTIVTSSVNPSVFGQSVTFTATVSAVAPGAGTPTGTVIFVDGSPIGTATLSGGVATFTTSALAVGSHTITTSYGGDGNFNADSSSLQGNPQVVNKADTNTTVLSSVNPSVFGQVVTFTATVSPAAPGAGTPTGTVIFLDGGSPIGTGTLSGGIAAFTTSALAVGNHTITTSYSGDGNFNSGTGSLTGNPQVVNKANTTTTVTSSVNPSALGQSVTFTAGVAPVLPGSGLPSGTVTFLDNGNPMGTATLGAAIAAFTTSGLTAGNHTITTSYGGDGNFSGGTGSLTGNPQVVIPPPVIAKVFNPSGIPVNGTSTLTFTITNPAGNTVAEAGVAFTDNLPSGLIIATPNNLNNTCGGTATATAGSGTVSLTGGTIAVNSSCTVSANVTSSEAGTYTNTTGNVSSTNGGTGNTATAVLAVAAPPTIAKNFGAGAVGQNTTVGLSFTIGNPNTSVTLTGISFTDSLPAGLVVATPNGVTNNCGGTVTAVAGSSSVSFTGGALDPPGPPPQKPTKGATQRRLATSSNQQGTCVVTVNLLVTGTGTLSNTTGPVSANESGPGTVSNTATLEVVLPPTVNKAFGAASIPLNGTTSLTFNIADPNGSTALVGIALNDTLPAGLLVANPNGLTGSCVASSTVNSGSNSISLTNLNLPASGSCSFSVNVTGTSAGTKNNTTGNISATFDDGSGTFRPVNGGTASASIAVVAPPNIGKAFVPAMIAANGVSVLTFTITDPASNAVAETGVAFTDTLPANVVVATPNGLSGSCGGTVTATAGTGTISLSGGTVSTSSSCVFSVNVTSSVLGSYTNTTSAVSSTNGGTGNTASATLTVAPAVLGITKTHQGVFKAGETGANWIITVSASATAGPTDGSTVTVTDTLPNVPNPPVPTAIGGTGWNCTLATLTCTRSDALASGASYPPITLTVNIPQGIVNSFTNTAAVTGGGDPNTHQASDKVTLGPPLQITSTDSGSASITHGSTALYHFQVDASGVNGLPIVVAFTCSGLPAGAACIFTRSDGTPAFAGGFSITQPITQVNMTVTTLGTSAHLRRRSMPFAYAALLFPVAGLVSIGLAGCKRKKLRLRLAMLLMGILILAVLAGCGGNGLVTPSGQSTITVTGTAQTTQGTVIGNTTVTLNVQ